MTGIFILRDSCVELAEPDFLVRQREEFMSPLIDDLLWNGISEAEGNGLQGSIEIPVGKETSNVDSLPHGV